jgi:hypothetical protein
MNFNLASDCRNFCCRSIAGLAGAIFFAVLLHAESAWAEDAADFRTRVIQEVLQEVPDLELAKQVVEIRINREFLKPQAVSNPSPKKLPASKSSVQQSGSTKEPSR